MLFRRRRPENVSERIRTWLWPRRSFARSMRYFSKRVLRLHATPHAIAAGVAAGVLASFTPLIGFHFLLSFAIAYVVAGNMAAAALGTAVGNPLTFPAIWAATYEIGRFVLQGDTGAMPRPDNIGRALAKMDFSAIWAPLLQPMFVGALILGTAVAGASYIAVFYAARGFQEARGRRMRDKRAAQAKNRHPTARAARGNPALPEV